MSLWVDGSIISSTTLMQLDSKVIDVAKDSKIPLDGPNGIIQQNWVDVGQTLVEWMSSLTGDVMGSAQAIFLGLSASNRGRYLLNQVVTTWQWSNSLSPLGMFAARKALVLFWRRSVRTSSKSDRFKAEEDEALDELRQAKRNFWTSGIPILSQPLPCPGAPFIPNSGTFGTTNVGPGPTATTSKSLAVYDVAVTWVDGFSYVSPLQPFNGESGPSVLVSAQINPGASLQVNINGLTPPGSRPYLGGVADGAYISRSATAWNVYAAPAGQPLVLQNAAPLPLTQTSYEMLSVLEVSFPLTQGQFAETNLPPQHSFSRA